MESRKTVMSVATGLLAGSLLLIKRRPPLRIHLWVLMEHPSRDRFLSCQSKDVPSASKEANVMSTFKKGKWESREQQNIQPHISPWEDYGENPSESCFQANERQDNWEQPDQTYQGQFILTNLIAISNETTSTVDEGRTVNVILLHFSKTLMFSHSFFAAKLRRCGLNVWTTSCVKNFLNLWAQRVGVKGLKPNG